MKKGIFFALIFSNVLFSAPNLPLDTAGAESFAKQINENPSELYLKNSEEFLSSSLRFYEANDLPSAYNNRSVAKFLAALSKSSEPLDAGVLAFFFSNQQFLNDFSSIISEKDNLPEVVKILNSLWKTSPDDFKAFPNLVAAIAIVFDALPPNDWPHHQVSEKTLPRNFQKPEDAFKMIVSDRRKGKFLLKTENLSIEELKFLVASLTKPEEREWAQRSISVNATTIGKLYSSIKYDTSRLETKAFNWGHPSYALADIKNYGGICTDQSYYTSEVAKAKGLPAFIFSGAGASGFHAWTAYMIKSGKWDFSVGRFSSGNFVTGSTIDPQTWEEATNHSLESLREAFRRNKKYQESEIHASFASHYLNSENLSRAKIAVEKSIKSHPRNFDAWTLLLQILENQNDEKGIDKTCYNAMKAFARSPDNDAFFRIKMIERLKKNGKKAEAKKLSNAFVLKNKSNRPDLSMYFARMELLDDIAEDDVKKLRSTYKRIFNIFKGNMAMTLEGLVIPVLQTLLKEGKTDKINEIVTQTRAIIKKSKDETVEANFEKVLAAFGNVAK